MPLHRRFWASVEPYCADITNEEIRVLEELLKPPDDEAEYYKIPALGKHYSQRWAQEDLLEEQREGARANDKKKSMMGPLSELDAKDVDALLKKSESQHEPPEDGCPFGLLTQRLLQALVEENIISPMEDSPIPDIPGKDDGAGTSPRSQGKAFSRFWASVEPYCADITNEEIRVLEELLKPPDDEAEYYKIPALGKHYSQRWAQEDLLEEQREGARANDKKKSMMGPLSELDAKDVDALLKKSESQHEPPEDGCPFGLLTQRLLQALVEENIISPMEDSPIPDIPGKDDGAGTSPRSQGKAFSVPHTRSLEARIREELVSQGLLDSDERQGVGGESEDEVLAELQKRQAELKALTAHNRSRKQELLKLAREEMRKQELRQRVRVADNEVMEAFRRIMAARQKKRTPTKKEKDQAWKALKERESILKLLDG
ncbi:transcriptional adapter 3-like [Sinocyclocheilus grahami]|nr:PREDICTED: transcriptional adapter 3-like [Sinocyclocheilus grahami]